MERIHGLTDDKAWKGEALFEKKLYYRAADVLSGDRGADDEDGMSEDENDGGSQTVPLHAYKSEKIEQVGQYHAELSMYVQDPEEAEQRWRNVRNKLNLSESMADVDSVVELFHNDLIHRQMVGVGNQT
jgi:hypothetical protein